MGERAPTGPTTNPLNLEFGDQGTFEAGKNKKVKEGAGLEQGSKIDERDVKKAIEGAGFTRCSQGKVPKKMITKINEYARARERKERKDWIPGATHEAFIAVTSGSKKKTTTYRTICGNKKGEYTFGFKVKTETVEVKKGEGLEWANYVLESGHTEVVDAKKIAKIKSIAIAGGAIGGDPKHAILATNDLVKRKALTSDEAMFKPQTLVVKEGGAYRVFMGTEKPA